RRRAGRAGRGGRLGRPVHRRPGGRGPSGPPHRRCGPCRARGAGRAVGRGRRGGPADALRHAGPAGPPGPAARRRGARGAGERGHRRTTRARRAGARGGDRGRAARARPARRAGARRVGGGRVTAEPAHARGGRRRRARVGLDRGALLRRLPALLALGGLIAAGVAADGGDAGGDPSTGVTPAAVPAHRLMPVAAAGDGGATWYCAAGTAGDDGAELSPAAPVAGAADEGSEGGDGPGERALTADHVVVVTNTGAEGRTAVVTVVGGDVARAAGPAAATPG